MPAGPGRARQAPVRVTEGRGTPRYLDLTLAINALLPDVARLATHEADRAAAQAGTMLAAELSDCYDGRLRTFLNPYGRAPGSASLVIRSKGHPRDPGSRARET